MKKIVIALFIIFTFYPFYGYSVINSSLYPIYSILAMVTDGISENGYIINPNTDPHSDELTYSQIKKIKSSDILIIVSPNLEKNIYQAVNFKHTKVISLENIPNLKIKLTENSLFDNHKKDSNNNTNDYHIWLDPDNAKIILAYLGEILSKEYPEHKQVYLDNVKKYQTKLTQLNIQVQKTLENENQNIIFYHGAFQYFVKKYNINSLGYIANENHLHDHNQSLSAKKILALKTFIKQNNIQCIFTEDQNLQSKKLMDQIFKNNPKITNLNPFISKNNKNPKENYFYLLNDIANLIKDCS